MAHEVEGLRGDGHVATPHDHGQVGEPVHQLHDRVQDEVMALSNASSSGTIQSRVF